MYEMEKYDGVNVMFILAIYCFIQICHIAWSVTAN